MKLTKLTIDKAKYEGNGKRRCIIWDSEIRGFGMRIYPSKKKAFILSYRIQCRKRLYTIGDYGVLTLDQARLIARKTLVQVLDGHDPLQVRQQENSGETMRDLCAAFLERHSKPKKKSWQADARYFDKHVLPAWANRKIKSITRQDVAALHSKFGKQSTYGANRMLSILSKLFEMAKCWGMLASDAENPAKGHDRFAEKKRDRWVKPDELPRVAKAVAAEKNIYVQAAIWLYLLTGVRKSELLNANWDDVDFKRRELRLGDTKAGRAHYIPLSAPAIELLQRLPRLKDNPHVLPGHNTGRPLVNISKPWLRIRKAADVEDVRLHDLRRTVGSMMAQAGSSLHLIGKVLNHSNVSTTQIYARLGDDLPRQALESHGKEIEKLISSRVQAN